MVLSRFRRGLATKLKALLAQRDSYVSYLAMTAKSQLVNNPEFRPIPNALAADYLMTTIDPRTNRPYSGGEAIRLDRKGQPQFIEAATAEVGEAEAGLAPFLLRQFHAAVGTGSQSIDLDTLMRDFQQQLEPQPIAVDESRLRAAFTRLIDVQRQALIVPYMMAFNAADDAIEIVDRRLFLYLKSVSIDDLEDLLDDVAPQDLPRARRRNRLSPEMTEEEQAAHIRTATGDRQQHDPSGDSVKEAEPVRASRGRNAKTAAHRRSLVEHPIRPVVSG
jgi:hypothetical protein